MSAHTMAPPRPTLDGTTTPRTLRNTDSMLAELGRREAVRQQSGS